jgi:hypothetical protein
MKVIHQAKDHVGNKYIEILQHNTHSLNKVSMYRYSNKQTERPIN